MLNRKGKEDETSHDKSHSLDKYDNLVRKLDEKEYEAFQEQQKAAKVKRCAICVASKIECSSMTIAEVKAHIKST